MNGPKDNPGEVRTLRLAVVCAALGAALGVVFLSAAVVFLYLLNHDLAARTSKDARDNKYALCTFRRDLEVRVGSSEAFLREHPNGIPGVPVKSIRDGIANQQRTIRALSALDC